MKLIDEREVDLQSGIENMTFKGIFRTYKSSTTLNRDNIVDFGINLINKLGVIVESLEFKNSETDEEFPFFDGVDFEKVKIEAKKLEFDIMGLFGEIGENEEDMIAIKINIKEQTVEVFIMSGSNANLAILETEID